MKKNKKLKQKNNKYLKLMQNNKYQMKDKVIEEKKNK